MVVAANNPLGQGRLTVSQFGAAAHVLTATEGGEIGVVDRALRRRGKRRYVGARVRDFTTALAIVAASDMVTTVPERLALRLADSLKLVVRDLPFDLPAIRIELIWHESRRRDPVLAWVRQAVEIRT